MVFSHKLLISSDLTAIAYPYSGAFSNVYKAIDLTTGKKVAGTLHNLV